MRRPILLDNPPPPPKLSRSKPSRSMPSDRWSRLLESRYLAIGGLMAGGAAAVVGASVALAMLMSTATPPNGPVRAEASTVENAAAKPAVVNPALAANGVQYVGDVKQADRPCEQQTWPYIAAQCLKPASGPAPAVAKVAVDRADLKASRAVHPSPAATAEQKVAEHAAPADQPVVQPVAHLTVPEAAPVPAARPARQQAVRDDAQSRRARSAARPEARDARAEARRDQASVIRPQSFHQAAAFTDER